MNNLKRERERRGWSRARLVTELAGHMGDKDTRYPISIAQIGRWERGESRPADYWIEKLCTVYGQTAEELSLYHATPISENAAPTSTVPARSPPAQLQRDAVKGASSAIDVEDDWNHARVRDDTRWRRHPRSRPGERHARRRWEATLHRREWTARISRPTCWICRIVLATVVLLLGSYLVLTLNPLALHGPSLASLAQFDGAIEGYLIAVEKRGNQDVLVALDPRTGLTHQLAPQIPPLIDGNSSASSSEYDSLIAPAYSPTRHLLAYIAISADGATNLWVAPLQTPVNSVPRMNPAQSRKLIANCGPACKTLTWSPSGKWLIVEGSSGLIAIETDTGQERIITQGAHDAWPTCSPNGSLLVYQRAVESLGYLVAAPADDCIPTAEAVAHARLVGEAVVSWHPMWSLDGKMLAYVSATTGRQVYVLSALGLFAGPTDSTATPLRSVSPVGCGDPVWVTEAQAHRNVVLFICSTGSGQRLVGALADQQDDELFAIGDSRVGEPALYNPIWIAP
jgi:transcriptional regulator with XRE-family HTH domain